MYKHDQKTIFDFHDFYPRFSGQYRCRIYILRGLDVNYIMRPTVQLGILHYFFGTQKSETPKISKSLRATVQFISWKFGTG